MNQIIHGNCLQIMDSIPNKSVSLIICDPPYGITASKWDRQINIRKMWECFNRIITKNGTILIFSTQPFTTKIISSNEKDFRYCWYWIKNQKTNFFHAKRMPLRKVEDICVFKKGKYFPQMKENEIPTNSAKGKSFGSCYHGINTRDDPGGNTTRFPTNTLEFSCVNNYSRKHPNEKPIKLLEYLIKTYTEEKDLILDPMAGSGSSGEASINTNRNFLLIEKEMQYIQKINERLKGKK